MTYTDKVVEFFRQKAMFFMANSGIRCLIREDLEDLASFSEQENKKAYKIIVDNIKKGGQDLDARLCPWCILLDTDCKKCGYGKRHGICSEHTSAYTRIGDTFNGKFENERYLMIIESISTL